METNNSYPRRYIKYNGYNLRYDYRYSVIELMVETDEHEGYAVQEKAVLDSANMPSEVWENKESRKNFLDDWIEKLENYYGEELTDLQERDKVNIEEFSPLMQLLYDRCIWNDANMGFIEYDELSDYGFTEQDVNNLLKEAEQFNLPISLEMSGDMPYLCGYQSLIKYFDNKTVEDKPKMPEISKTDEGRKLSQAEELAKSSQSKDKE